MSYTLVGVQHNEDPPATPVETWSTIYSGVSARFVHSDGQGWQIPAFGVAAQAVLMAAAASNRADVAAALAIGSMAVGTSAIFMLLDHKLAANTDQLILREIELLLLHGDDSGVMTDPSTFLTPFATGGERFQAMRRRYPDRLSLRGGLIKRWSPHWWAASLIGLLIIGGLLLFVDGTREEGLTWKAAGLGVAFVVVVLGQGATRLTQLLRAENVA